jgi:hypothetical protein
VRFRRRYDDRRQPFDIGVLAMAVAALAVAIAVSVTEPVDGSVTDGAGITPMRADLAVIARATSAPAATGLPRGLMALPDVQSPWLYAFAGQISASAADADSDDCVRVEGYYSQTDGMQLERVDSVLHRDSSADITIGRLPVISHKRFGYVIVGDVDFAHAGTIREHTTPGELAFAIAFELPQTEMDLFAALLAASSPDRKAQHAVIPVNVFDAIVDTSYWQNPRRQTRTAMLRLLARLPGVHVDVQAQDPLLRLMVAVATTTASGERTAYFAPDTGQLLAYTEITQSGYIPAGTKLPHLRQALLYEPGCTSDASARPETAHRLFRTQRLQGWLA